MPETCLHTEPAPDAPNLVPWSSFFAMVCPEFPTCNKKPSPTASGSFSPNSSDAQRLLTLSPGAGPGLTSINSKDIGFRFAHIVIPLTGETGNVIWGTAAVANATGLMRLDQPETLGAGHCLHPPFDGEFHKDVFDVRFDRFRCNAEVACDLLVGLAVADQLENAGGSRLDQSAGQRHRSPAAGYWQAIRRAAATAPNALLGPDENAMGHVSAKTTRRRVSRCQSPSGSRPGTDRFRSRCRPNR